MSYHEDHRRSIVKAISYRIISVTIDSIFVFAITKKTGVTLSIVVITNTYSTLLYYGHERVWNTFHFGRKILITKARRAVRSIRRKKVSS